MEDNEILLQVKDITKVFPGVKALKGVDMTIRRGEVHALIGENGAGKSTLMKIILGSYQPTSGEMFLRGEPYRPKAPIDALSKGISMIHQEISLTPTMSVSENVWIGREDQFSNKVFVNRRKQEQATREILLKLGLDIAPDTIVSTLSIAKMQLVEIARAVSYQSDIIIMDEPTSALTDAEVDKLYTIIEDLRAQGKSVIFISHKLDEIFHICDRITVLRDGAFIKELNAKTSTKEELITLMVGREMSNVYPKQIVPIGEPVLEVCGFTQPGVFEDVSFTVHSGEILGFAGLIGAGRTEIMRAIFGIDPHHSGQLLMHGTRIENKNPSQAIANKLSMVTEDRLRSGAIHGLAVRFNASIAYLKKITKYGLVNKKQEQADVTDMVQKMAIKVANLDGSIDQLSGGNQQKVILAKWMLTEPEVLILDEPTRGIDVGAKAEIYKLMGLLAAQGKAVIMVSSDLPELMGVSDRILVVRQGRIAGEFQRAQFDQEKIMQHAFGVE